MKHLSSLLKSTVLFIASLLVFLSLVSYSSKDISFLFSPTPVTIFNFIGIAGAYLSFLLLFVFGYGSYVFPFCLFFFGLDKLEVIRFRGLGRSKLINAAAFLFFSVFSSAFIGLFLEAPSQVFKYSGLAGFYFSGFFKKYLGPQGSFIIVFLLLAVSSILFFGFFYVDIFRGLRDLFLKIADRLKQRVILPPVVKSQVKKVLPRSRQKEENIKPQIKVYEPKLNPQASSNAEFALGSNSPKLKSVSKPCLPAGREEAKKKIESLQNQNDKVFDPLSYKLPHPGMLKVPSFSNQSQAKEDIQANIKNLEATLSDFGVEAKVVSVQKGPVVTMYELLPQPGTKIQKISVLSDDIALSMKSSLVRVIAPIPGRGTVGIEIPNLVKHLVFLREVLEEKVFLSATSKLTLVIGKDVSGNPVVADLNQMPHLLIAGATGAGKTVCVNSMICSILFKARPDQVKFIMVDPKMVELAAFSGIPHLIHPIISDAKKAYVALNWAVEEMERRYKILAEAGCRNIDAYNQNGNPHMPYIVIVVDELADLMIVARDTIEIAIQRLAQLSRAVGIHLVLATQRPSVDVITGVIKANFPARISFKVASKVDSRTVLDMMGADKLLGQGDLLFLKPGAVKLIRAQGSFIDDDDIGTLTDFIRVQGAPVYEDAISEGAKKQSRDLGSDELFDDAVKVILRTRQASASLLQRRLRVGYTRAARLLDIMEQESIVGPFRGSKAREILVDPEGYLIEKGLV